jgi:hypothetical protein
MSSTDIASRSLTPPGGALGGPDPIGVDPVAAIVPVNASVSEILNLGAIGAFLATQDQVGSAAAPVEIKQSATGGGD